MKLRALGSHLFRFAVVSLLLVWFAGAVSAQTLPSSPEKEEQDDVVRVSTNLVTIPVTVKTREGGYVPNLKRDGFHIYEDGVEQQISHFETVEQPFTVVLMLDTSDSTQAKLSEIQNAAIAFLDQLRPADRAVIFAFDKAHAALTTATNDRTVLASAIRRTASGGGTALYDSLDSVVKDILKRIPGRKAIVLLSDGIDTSSVKATFASVVDLAEEDYSLIYPIQWDTSGDTAHNQASGTAVTYTTPSGESLRSAYDRGTRFLERLAATSGGRFQFADSLKALERSFARIAEELREQYSLGYYPKSTAAKSKKREIKVTVDVPDAIVHARKNYSYDPGP